MVRREDTGPTEGRLTEQSVSRCSSPAGESPVRVRASERAVAGHRLRLRSRLAKRGVESPQRQKPPTGSKSAGRNIK
jgi:hypothetical protein